MTDRAAFARDTRANERSFHIDEAELRVRDYPIRTVARGLNNPRGMEKLPDGSLLVAEAGTGTRPDSRVIRLEPCSKGYRIAQVLLDEQPSVSVGPDVKREEIMGAAAIHARASSVFGLFVDSRRRVTRMLEILPEAGRLRCELPGNVMDFAHDPAMSMEYAVSSDRDCIYQLDREGGSIVWVTLSREVTGQHQGQRAVPCALCHDPWSGALLVTLLSGEVHGEHREGDLHPASSTGLNFLHGVARVLAVDPREGTIETHVAGLTLATNAVAHGPHLFVLEGCNAFLDPMVREEHFQRPRHGGFRRFSGRLLHIDRRSGVASILAEQLDLPSNLLMTDNHKLLVSQGAGTIGRPIPGPDGQPVALEGFISEIDLRPLLEGAA